MATVDDVASDRHRARRWRVGLALALVSGIVTVGAVFAFRPAPRPWVVDFVVEHPGLDYEAPCTSVSRLVTGGYITRGGAYGGLLATANEVDAHSVGDCWVAHGATVEVRRQTDDDTRRLKEMGG